MKIDVEKSLIKFRELKRVEKIPFDVFTLDLLTKGGIPEGRFTLLWGDKGAGKSTTALRLTKSFLLKYPDRKVCYMDFEHAFDVSWAEKIVGDTDNLLLAQPDYAEEGIALLQELIKNPEIGLYVIDSLAMIIPTSETDSEPDQDFVGLQARTINKMLRKVIPMMSRHNKEGNPVTFVLINQCRSSFGSKTFVKSYAKPGGYFQDFLASLEIRFYVDGVHKDEEVTKATTYAFVIEKNKVGGVPKVIGKYTMVHVNTGKHKAGDVIDENIILDFLKKFNLLKKEKKYILLGEEYRTQAEIKDRIINEIDFKRKLTKLIIEKYYDAEM